MAYRVGFIIEQALGHLTHHRNLAEAVMSDPDCRPLWMPIPYVHTDRWSRLPIIRGNWSLSLSLRARAYVGSAIAKVDALLFHTQVTALFSLSVMRKIPSVVSLDATPANRFNLEGLAEEAGQPVGRITRAKRLWISTTLRTAAHVVAWSQWCADSIVHDYGIRKEHIRVIPPGVNLNVYQPGPTAEKNRHLPRLLFVGGDFHRKGGAALLSVFRESLRGRCELDIVTNDTKVESGEGVRVHRDLLPNSNQIRALYAKADIFVLPTFKDFSPLSVMEAMASGLPVVASKVGAIHEQVAHNQTGLLIPPPRDGRALSEALGALIDDSARRRRFGAAGRARAQTHFDAAVNYRQLLGLLKSCAEAKQCCRSRHASSLTLPQVECEPACAIDSPA